VKPRHSEALAFAWGWLALSATSCATAIHGPMQTVSIRSTPSGATATIFPLDSQVTTPADVKLMRRGVYTVRFEKEGYRCVLAYLDRRSATAAFFNVGLFGTMRDYETGAAFALVPSPLEVEMRPLSELSATDAGRCDSAIPIETVYDDGTESPYTRAPDSNRSVGLER
jgi:hypothetical protein